MLPLTNSERYRLLAEMQDLANADAEIEAPIRALRDKDGKCPGQIMAEAFGGVPHGTDSWHNRRDEDRERFTKSAVAVLRVFMIQLAIY